MVYVPPVFIQPQKRPLTHRLLPVLGIPCHGAVTGLRIAEYNYIVTYSLIIHSTKSKKKPLSKFRVQHSSCPLLVVLNRIHYYLILDTAPMI